MSLKTRMVERYNFTHDYGLESDSVDSLVEDILFLKSEELACELLPDYECLVSHSICLNYKVQNLIEEERKKFASLNKGLIGEIVIPKEVLQLMTLSLKQNVEGVFAAFDEKLFRKLEEFLRVHNLQTSEPHAVSKFIDWRKFFEKEWA